MAQHFRHLIRGLTPAEVEAHAAAHGRAWWQDRSLAITVRGDQVRARRAGGGGQPPVLHGTLRPADDAGTVVEGTLHRGSSAAFDHLMLVVATISGVLAVAAILDGSPWWLSVGAVLATLVFLAMFAALRHVGRLAQPAEARELQDALDAFFAG